MSDNKTMEGEVIQWLKTFGFISSSDQGLRKRFPFSSRGIQPDWKGSRGWSFGRNIPVKFELMERFDEKRGLNQVAINVRPIFPMSEPQNLEDYSEVSTVTSVRNGYVFLQRPCGDLIFLHKNDTVDRYRDRWALLVEGTPVYHKIVYDDAQDRFQASEAELYSAEELEQFFNQTEVEPEAIAQAEPETVVEPGLETVLAPSTRSLPLIEIVRRRKS